MLLFSFMQWRNIYGSGDALFDLHWSQSSSSSYSDYELRSYRAVQSRWWYLGFQRFLLFIHFLQHLSHTEVQGTWCLSQRSQGNLDGVLIHNRAQSNIYSQNRAELEMPISLQHMSLGEETGVHGGNPRGASGTKHSTHLFYRLLLFINVVIQVYLQVHFQELMVFSHDLSTQQWGCTLR